MVLKKFVFLSLFICFYAAPLSVAQKLPDRTVVVTSNASPVPFENLSRTLVVFDRETIDALPVRSVADILKYAASVDVRSRSPRGMQADISIRGSAYSQVLLLVDGVRVNDSQTGHHNSDFPVQFQDVERIEILMGAGSSIYGADAFGGTINIITKQPSGRASGTVAFGQYGLFDGSFATSFGKGRFKQSVSFSGSRSSGFQYDRDFKSVAISSRMALGGHSSVYVSHVDKDFGANGFYGPAPSKEWTNQTFITAERNFEHGSGNSISVKGFYRTHGDRFLYDIRTPDLYENRHRTHSTGGRLKSRYRLSDTGVVTIGGEMGGDWIDSSNLGNHSFSRASLFGEFQWMPASSKTPERAVALYPGLRFDYYSNFGVAVSPSLSGSWWIVPRVRLRSSLGHAFRIPTFTELYYRDPNHQASSDLEPERAWTIDAGADYIPSNYWLASLTIFARKEKDVIDWIRQSDTEPWRTSNIRDLHTTGFEASLEHSFDTAMRLSGRYSYTSMSAGSINYISKYVLDYARHSLSLSSSFELPLKMKYSQSASYRKRSDGHSYWILDGCLEKAFYGLTAALDFTNLLGSRYQEIRGVDMPGRWFVFSLNLK